MKHPTSISENVFAWFGECGCFNLGKIARMKMDALDDLILIVSHQYVLWHIVNYVHSANSDFHFNSESH